MNIHFFFKVAASFGVKIFLRAPPCLDGGAMKLSALDFSSVFLMRGGLLGTIDLLSIAPSR